MKILKLIFAMLFVLVANHACTYDTEYGECIGVFDEGDPDLVYRASLWNTVIAIGCAQTIIVPAHVIVSEAKCPIRRKVVKEKVTQSVVPPTPAPSVTPYQLPRLLGD